MSTLITDATAALEKPVRRGAIDSFVGHGLAPSPYAELVSENLVLRALLQRLLNRLSSEL